MPFVHKRRGNSGAVAAVAQIVGERITIVLGQTTQRAKPQKSLAVFGHRKNMPLRQTIFDADPIEKNLALLGKHVCCQSGLQQQYQTMTEDGFQHTI